MIKGKPIADGLDSTVRHSRTLPLIVGWALFMQTLDATIVSNALPRMAESLHRDPVQLNIVITAYLLALTMFLPVTGWLADRFGARPVFSMAIGIFTISSVFCGLADSLPMLIGARIVQGASASMMTPVGRLILLKTSPRQHMVRSMSFLIFPGVLGTILGPPLGGYLVTFASWRWIFYINLPMGIAGVALVLLYVPRLREAVSRRLDLPGFLMSASGLALLVYGFEGLSQPNISVAMVSGCLAAGAVMIVIFTLHCLHRKDALLNVSIMAERVYRGATIGGFFARLAVGASPFTLALFLQLGLGFTPFQAGLIGTAEAIGSLALIGSASTLIAIFGYRRILITVVTLTSISIGSYAAFESSTPVWVMVSLLFVGGASRSILFTALNAVAFANVPDDLMSRASSLSAMIQQLALSIGVGLAALIVGLSRGNSSVLGPEQFQMTFITIALISLLGLLFLRELPTVPVKPAEGQAGKRDTVKVARGANEEQ